MKYENKSKAVYLFREIGGIDDRLVQEAVAYRPQRLMPHFFLIAACLTLSLLLSVGAFLIAMQSDKSDAAGSIQPSDGAEGAQTLDDVLLYANAQTTLTSADAIDFFGESAHVVWQSSTGGEIHVSRALTDAELEDLIGEIENGKAVSADTSEPDWRVWIVVGDGTVLSPHLLPSSGNVGSAELFDYHAELIPSADFNSGLSEILN